MNKLSSVQIGESVTVRKFDLNAKTALRLQALGMIPGTQVTVLQKKGKGTMIIDLRGTRFALGPSISENIEVSYAK